MSTTNIYTGPDPDTTTRAEFTIHHLNRQCPTVCSPRFSHIFKVHQTLIRLMDAHPAMDQNRNQTYNTPAASKNKVGLPRPHLRNSRQCTSAKPILLQQILERCSSPLCASQRVDSRPHWKARADE
ncbi:hypothetical protein D6C95_10409 [Aureobasidium pullulans]|nr:hypothetical protein D6C95_10409 [Aureobasidium pullulans]